MKAKDSLLYVYTFVALLFIGMFVGSVIDVMRHNGMSGSWSIVRVSGDVSLVRSYRPSPGMVLKGSEWCDGCYVGGCLVEPVLRIPFI